MLSLILVSTCSLCPLVTYCWMCLSPQLGGGDQLTQMNYLLEVFSTVFSCSNKMNILSYTYCTHIWLLLCRLIFPIHLCGVTEYRNDWERSSTMKVWANLCNPYTFISLTILSVSKLFAFYDIINWFWFITFYFSLYKVYRKMNTLLKSNKIYNKTYNHLILLSNEL